MFKDFEQQPYFQRKSFANFRIGTFKIRIETQRYFRPKIPLEEHYCVTCPDVNYEIENENHYLFTCSAYSQIRQVWLSLLEKPEDFDFLSLDEKLKIVLNKSINVKPTVKFIVDAFDIRSKTLF